MLSICTRNIGLIEEQALGSEGFSFIFYPFAKIGKAMNLKLCYKSYGYAEEHYSRLPQGVIA